MVRVCVPLGAMAARLAPQITREAALTLAMPSASLRVILAVQYQTAEQEKPSRRTSLAVVTMGAFIWSTPDAVFNKSSIKGNHGSP